MSGTAPAHPLDVFKFVFHIDLLLLGLFAVYVLSTLPRALARFSRPSELLDGLFIRTGYQPVSIAHVRRQSTRTHRRVRTIRQPSEDEHTVVSHAYVMHASSSAAPTASTAPMRVPRWTTLVHPLMAYALNYRVSPGLSIGKLVTLSIYFGINLYAGIYRSNPFTDPIRTGYVAMSQVPIVVALAGKNNWLSWACGVGYEKLNYIHRFAGYVIVLALNVHTVGYLYMWSLNGTMRSEFHNPKFIAALVATSALDILAIGSTSFVRQKMYTLFLSIHIVGVNVFLVATYFHSHTTLPYILTGLGLYVCDHIIRLFKTRFPTALLSAEPHLNSGSSHLYFPTLTKGWRAGQHVRIRVVSPGRRSWVGWWAAWLVGHARPFTIASAANGHGMELIVKKHGVWTHQLFDMAVDDGDSEKGRKGKGSRNLVREVRVLVEGPYSGPGNTLFTAYSGALLVAGGSGITYVLSILDDILQKHAQGRSRLRAIELIWAITDPDSLTSILPALTSLMRPRPSPHASLAIRLTVHHTRASPHTRRLPGPGSLPAGVYLRPGRPDIPAVLRNTIESVLAAYDGGHHGEAPSGIVVGTCGPLGLADEVTRAVGKVRWKPWKDVGGVETVDECVLDVSVFLVGAMYQ
ncbi:hypothetical protein BV25DRAFT_1668797 [Artomyces pyxidatus]|uniref:Uncharacterized protein n=1 Tax=Artomyces pyxidatus TaxID=48021 RepID=A0ACB8SI89_9AGAM|nr:hypothetical protein BV25DRAFT_1668797 [Artomyces pyxidatus]